MSFVDQIDCFVTIILRTTEMITASSLDLYTSFILRLIMVDLDRLSADVNEDTALVCTLKSSAISL